MYFNALYDISLFHLILTTQIPCSVPKENEEVFFLDPLLISPTQSCLFAYQRSIIVDREFDKRVGLVIIICLKSYICITQKR